MSSAITFVNHRKIDGYVWIGKYHMDPTNIGILRALRDDKPDLFNQIIAIAHGKASAYDSEGNRIAPFEFLPKNLSGLFEVIPSTDLYFSSFMMRFMTVHKNVLLIKGDMGEERNYINVYVPKVTNLTPAIIQWQKDVKMAVKDNISVQYDWAIKKKLVDLTESFEADKLEELTKELDGLDGAYLENQAFIEMLMQLKQRIKPLLEMDEARKNACGSQGGRRGGNGRNGTGRNGRNSSGSSNSSSSSKSSRGSRY